MNINPGQFYTYKSLFPVRKVQTTSQDMQLFFDNMGTESCKTIELAVMDMWKPFRKATLKNAPNAHIVYGKFHIMKHLADALDQVRRSEYKRVNEKERRFIKGQVP